MSFNSPYSPLATVAASGSSIGSATVVRTTRLSCCLTTSNRYRARIRCCHPRSSIRLLNAASAMPLGCLAARRQRIAASPPFVSWRGWRGDREREIERRHENHVVIRRHENIQLAASFHLVDGRLQQQGVLFALVGRCSRKATIVIGRKGRRCDAADPSGYVEIVAELVGGLSLSCSTLTNLGGVVDVHSGV